MNKICRALTINGLLYVKCDNIGRRFLRTIDYSHIYLVTSILRGSSVCLKPYLYWWCSYYETREQLTKADIFVIALIFIGSDKIFLDI